MSMGPIEKKIALHILNQWRERFAEHEEAGREYAKQGYRNATCVHGTDQWTDYDNICGPCEDGYGYWDYMQFLELARGEARWIYKNYMDARNRDREFFIKMFDTVKDDGTAVREAAGKLMQEMNAETDAMIEKYL